MSPLKLPLQCALPAVVVGVLLLAGCGGGEQNGGNTSTNEEVAAQSYVETSSGAPKEGPQTTGSAPTEAPVNSSDGAQEEGEDMSESEVGQEVSVTASPLVAVPADILEAAAVPSLGNLTSVTQRGEGPDTVWALRYGLGETSWEGACRDYGKSLKSLGFDQAISETNSLYASGTFLGKSHSISYSCEKGSMVILVGPGW